MQAETETKLESSASEVIFQELTKNPAIGDRYSSLMTILRDKETLPTVMREIVREMGRLTADVIAFYLPKDEITVETGNRDEKGNFYLDTSFGGHNSFSQFFLCPALRAGQYFAEGIEQRTFKKGIDLEKGYIGIKRSETENAEKQNFEMEYEVDYIKLPGDDPNNIYSTMKNKHVILADVLNASAGTLKVSINKTVERCTENSPSSLFVVTVLSANEGVKRVQNILSNLVLDGTKIYHFTGDIDYGGINGTGLNKYCYIDPGMGDAGDRTHMNNMAYAWKYLRIVPSEFPKFLREHPYGVRTSLQSLLLSLDLDIPKLVL